jgi:hypothetical protein
MNCITALTLNYVHILVTHYCALDLGASSII